MWHHTEHCASTTTSMETLQESRKSAASDLETNKEQGPVNIS